MKRAVVLVGNPAAPYSRALRIARALLDAGYAVELAAVSSAAVPDREMEGPIAVRRYPPSGRLARMAPEHIATGGSQATGRRALPVRTAAAVRRWLFWPHTVRGWWATLDRELEPADLYHACGSLTVAAALAARDRDRRAGRVSYVIYDAIDDVAHSNNVLSAPPPIRWMIERRERRWARAADARITVNDDLATALGRSWRTPPPIAVPNWPEPSLAPGSPPDDRIREALHLLPSTRIALFEGRLGPNLGLDEAAEAILAVPDAVLCLIGFGRGLAASRARDVDPRYAGRHWTLPAVHPDEILAWAASADVALVPLPPISANQRAATPNKFWEAIAAGTPVVIGPGLPAMARLVGQFDLGVVADSLSPADLSRAVRSVIDVAPDVAVARRERISGVAREHFQWPVAAGRYRRLVADLTGAEVRATAGTTDAPVPSGFAAPSHDLARRALRPVAVLARRAVAWGRRRADRRRTARAEADFRLRRSAAAAAGPTTRVLLYSPANLNVIDGSSIWVEAVAATLATDPGVWLTVPLKARERRRIISDALRAIDRVEVLPVDRSTSPTRTQLDTESALGWIEHLDAVEPFDILVLRGFELCRAAIRRSHLAGRLWSTYILEPERDPDAPAYQDAMGEIAMASARILSQTDAMRLATEERVPAAVGKTLVFPPAIPSDVPRADPARPIRRLIYAGKFAPFYPVPDLIDAYARLRADHPGLEFHLIGDKVWRSPDDHGYADALEHRIQTVPGIVRHGGLSRSSVARLLAEGGIALSVWDYDHGSHWNDLVVSTKLLDYCAAGLPVILNRTEAQETILGADYPLFLATPAEAEALVDRVLRDDRLYRTAAQRCWRASRQFTYAAVHSRLAPELAAHAHQRTAR